jgi:hypothetical protein
MTRFTADMTFQPIKVVRRRRLAPRELNANKLDAKIICSKRLLNTVLNVVLMSILRLKSRRTAGSSHSTLALQGVASTRSAPEIFEESDDTRQSPKTLSQ